MSEDGVGIQMPEPGLQVASDSDGMVYELGDVLGEGAFGLTFEASNLFDEPLVAKVLRPRDDGLARLVAEWQREAQFLAVLRHPHVIHIHDAFEFGGFFYLILERADGSLRRLIDMNGPLDPGMVVEVGRQLLSALHVVHHHRVIHRDLHVDNVLYTYRCGTLVTKLSDFGISKHLGEAEARAYTRIGRGLDVAPELVERGYTTPQSDIYQLGLVLYHLLTGEPALTPGDGEVAHAILSGVARDRAAALDTDVGAWISVMLRPREEMRFEQALDVWLALKLGWED